MRSIGMIPTMKRLRVADHHSASRILPLRRWLIPVRFQQGFRVQGKLESHSVAALAGFPHISALGVGGGGGSGEGGRGEEEEGGFQMSSPWRLTRQRVRTSLCSLRHSCRLLRDSPTSSDSSSTTSPSPPPPPPFPPPSASTHSLTTSLPLLAHTREDEQRPFLLFFFFFFYFCSFFLSAMFCCPHGVRTWSLRGENGLMV